MDPLTPEQLLAQARLTEAERDILAHLASAWNGFIQLPDVATRPSFDREDFRQAIDQASRILATRVAVRLEPDQWHP
jgi:hypothetical protein